VLRPLLLCVYTGLTHNHRHDREGRGGRGKEEDSPHCHRAVLTLASLSLMFAQLSQETRGSCQGGVSHTAKQTTSRVQCLCVQIQEYTQTGHLLGPSGQPAVTIFRIEGLVCYTALTSARPSRSSALRHGAPLTKVISTRCSPSARMRACTRARCFSPYIPAFFCPVHARESLASPNLEYDYLTRKTGRMCVDCKAARYRDCWWRTGAL